jgi:hypothetical protein
MRPERERTLQALKIAEDLVYHEFQDLLLEEDSKSTRLREALRLIQSARAILQPKSESR